MIIGTRGSKLALAQATIVQEKLQASGIKTTINVIKTSGDRITDRPLHAVSGFGAFVREIDSAMLAGEIDLAVHSMKDVPTERPDGLVTAAVLKRDSPFDALITRDGTLLDELPLGAVIGTTSLRRRAQILRYRSDFVVRDLRGNIDTRLRKLRSGEYDAIMLAEAGLERMNWDPGHQRLSSEHFIPSANQGTIVIVTRKDTRAEKAAGLLDHAPTRLECDVERIIISVLGGGCSAPVAAFAEREGNHLHVTAEVLSIDATRRVRIEEEIPVADYALHSRRLGEELKVEGGGELVDEAVQYFSDVRGDI
ncbi:MAG TPA: hydroxymethylbilane synthase [Candidatus Methanoperedenaceae archaeon]|nr:hydroxymethylbilane synthase [Candidatus Methanoperedenaceae archaeon]